MIRWLRVPLASFVSFVLAFQLVEREVHAAAATPPPPPPPPAQSARTPASKAAAPASVNPLSLPPSTRRPAAADPTDAYVIAKADELGRDPARLFAYVRDEIGFEAYRGSLRGARGTLWNKAGNSLDRASLLVALLRASGLEARYVRGALDNTRSGQLIARMFPAPYGVIGCPPSGSVLADPVSDATLLSEASDHFWAEYRAGGAGAFTAADTGFRNATPGQVFAAASGNFTEVPAELRHKVSFTANAEVFSQASAAFGAGGLSAVPVLEATFDAADLVGKPLTYSHFVDSSSIGALVFSSQTHRYSPYLILGAGRESVDQDEVIRGTDFQEVLTNFPLGSQVLTGVFLEIRTQAPGSPARKFDKTMFDRIGFAGRRGGASVSVAPTSRASMTQYDMITLNVLPGLQEASAIAEYQRGMDALRTASEADRARLTGVNLTNPTPAESLLIRRASQSGANFLSMMGRALTASFAAASDQEMEVLQTGFYVRSYWDSPRILAASSRMTPDGAGWRLALGMDLVKDDPRVLAAPLQTAAALKGFGMVRGVAESQLEGELLRPLAADLPNDIRVAPAVSSFAIFEAARQQSIPVLTLSAANATGLDGLTISADAKARVSEAIALGHVVLIPSRPVDLGGGAAMSGWFDTDPATGALAGVLEDGSRGAVVEYGGRTGLDAAFIAYSREPVMFLLGFTAGYFVSIAITTIFGAIFPARPGDRLSKIGLNVLQQILDALTQASESVLALIADPAAKLGFQLGSQVGSAFAYAMAAGGVDPPLPPARFGLVRPRGQTPSPGGSAGVTARVDLDTVFTVPVGGTAVPLAYRTTIRNTGPSAETFQIALQGAPAGFTLESGLPAIEIPAGSEAVVGACVVPSGGLPAPGTPGSFQVRVTSAANAAVTTAVTRNFVTPEVKVATLEIDPQLTSATPGSSAPVRFRIRAQGNVPATVALSVITDNGLTLTGLPSSVAIVPGQVIPIDATATVASGAALGSALTARAEAVWGNRDNNEVSRASFQIQVVPASARSALSGAAGALNLGRTDIAAVLSSLSSAMATLAGACTEAARGQVLARVDALIRQMNAPYLANFAAELQTARAALASAPCGAINTALDGLGAVLSRLSAALSSPAAYDFDFFLNPNTATAQPGSPTSFRISLQNRSMVTATYTLALGPLPAGVAGSLNRTTITLAPGQFVPANPATDPVVTVTPAATNIEPFTFDVTASVNGVAGSARTMQGAFTPRTEFLQVAAVTPTPAFTNAGGAVNVVARIANVANQARNIGVVLTVKNSANVTVRTQPAVNATLSLLNLVTDVNLGSLDTTGIANGPHTLEVTVLDAPTGAPIPGGTGSGFLLIGTPVEASLAISPTTLAPGNGQVTATLTVNSTAGGGAADLSLLGSVALPGEPTDLVPAGNLVYVCNKQNITVVNVAAPASPAIVVTNSDQNFVDTSKSCAIANGKLFTVNNSVMNVFTLANPVDPQISSVNNFFNKLVNIEAIPQGNHVLVPTNVIRFFFGGNYISQRGDVVSVDVTDTTPAVVGTMFRAPTFDVTAIDGGPFAVFGATRINANTLLAGSTTTPTGPVTATGTGRVFVVDTGDPAVPTIVGETLVPAVRQAFPPAISGTQAAGVGPVEGWRNPLTTGFPLGTLVGPMSVYILDVSNQRAPVLLNTVATTLLPLLREGAFTNRAVLGDRQYLFTARRTDTQNVFVKVDARNPASPLISTIDLPAAPNKIQREGNLLYVGFDNNNFAVYQISSGGGAPQYTARVRVPKGTGVAVEPGSFNLAPTATNEQPGYSELVWTNPGRTTLTWRENITGLAAGESRAVIASGGTVEFTSGLGNGTIALPPASVTSEHILALAPPSRTVTPGELAAYTLTVRNPLITPVTYTLSVAGVPAAWVTLAASVTVPAGGSVDVSLQLRSELAAAAATYGFRITAASGGGASAQVNGTIVLSGASSTGNVVSANSPGVELSLAPAQRTGGRGGTVRYIARVTNTGNLTATYALTAPVLPAGLTGLFSSASLPVPSGLGNFREVFFDLTAAPATAPGAKVFTLRAASTADPNVSDEAGATLDLVNTGVTVALSPASTAPGGTIALTVRNTGGIADTFDLTLGGPGALISTLAAASVTLAPGASQVVNIAIGPASFASLGSLSLVATATSRATPSVIAQAAAAIAVGASRGVGAAFRPTRTSLAAPGAATMLLEIQNTGTLEDAYSVRILQTTGPIRANLLDLSGQAAQSIPLFRLPGVTNGLAIVEATLTGTQDGAVVVEIVSTTDGSVKATATGTLGLGGQPVADAGKDRNVPAGRYAALDGSDSYNPSASSPIAYRWRLVNSPPGSAAALSGATGPRPVFLPDVAGPYEFELVVSANGTDSAPDRVTIRAFTGNVPPNADAGRALDARRAVNVNLNGSGSEDPDRGPQPLSFLWRFQSQPAGSSLPDTAIVNRTGAQASFTPAVAGVYTLALDVSDGAAASSDTVAVTVTEPNVTPNANAGVNRRVPPNVEVQLDGSRSLDPDNGPGALAFRWRYAFTTQANPPVLNDALTARARFTATAIGHYAVTLEASDTASAGVDTVLVTVSGACDANADGAVNAVDVDLIRALTGAAAGAQDPLDRNNDGLITAADTDACAALLAQPPPTPAPVTNRLNVQPESLTFLFQRGAAPPAPQFVEVDGDPVGFAPAVVFGSWIQVTANRNLPPARLVVSIDAAALAPGIYDGLIVLRSPQAANLAQVRVRLTVIDPPRFVFVPERLAFSAGSGQPAPPPQRLFIYSTGRPVGFRLAADVPWVKVSAPQTETPAIADVVVDPGSLPPGTHRAVIAVTPSDAAGGAVPGRVELTLELTQGPPRLLSIKNAASLESGPGIAPGEVLLLEGADFAPPGTALQAPPNQPRLPLALGETRVLFDNQPAPLLWLQPGALAVIAPYALEGRRNTDVTVERGKAPLSFPFGRPILAAVPGIYTADGSGRGAVLAINQDGSRNSPTNPAPRGTTVTIFITGEGPLEPAAQDGQILAGPPLPVPRLPIQAELNDQPATIEYAGSAAQVPAGIGQINLRIQPGLALGGTSRVGIRLLVQGARTQDGIWIFVKE